jgi:hypothetical protein
LQHFHELAGSDGNTCIHVYKHAYRSRTIVRSIRFVTRQHNFGACTRTALTEISIPIVFPNPDCATQFQEYRIVNVCSRIHDICTWLKKIASRPEPQPMSRTDIWAQVSFARPASCNPHVFNFSHTFVIRLERLRT